MESQVVERERESHRKRGINCLPPADISSLARFPRLMADPKEEEMAVSVSVSTNTTKHVKLAIYSLHHS